MGTPKPTSGNPNGGTCYIHVDDVITISLYLGAKVPYRKIATELHASYTTISDVNKGRYDDWITEKAMANFVNYELKKVWSAIFPGASSPRDEKNAL